MRDIIELCIELDTTAIDTYARLSADCDDPAISRLFEQMGKEEQAHVGWWTDLLRAWDTGLVPPVTDEEELRASLTELAQDMREAVPADFAGLSVDEMLSVSAHLEFYMLDPAFAELIDLVRPTSRIDVRDAYSRHVMRLVNAIENRHSRTELSHFLARALARTLRDQQRLGKLATQDPLTELYNRRGFYGYLEPVGFVRHALRAPAVRTARGYRPVQDHQRHLRPPGRRRSTQDGRLGSQASRSGLRHRWPLWGR